MTNARPRTEWSSPSIVVTIVLALLAAQTAYYNFNDTAKAELGVLKTDLAILKHRLDRLEQDVHGTAQQRRR